jgi:hypothetical protein
LQPRQIPKHAEAVQEDGLFLHLTRCWQLGAGKSCRGALDWLLFARVYGKEMSGNRCLSGYKEGPRCLLTYLGPTLPGTNLLVVIR